MDSRNPDSSELTEQMIEKYADMVYRIAYSQTKKKELAEDVFQEVFLRYLQKGPSAADGELHLKHWLIRVTVNRCHSLFSGSWFRKTAPLDDSLTFASPEQNEVYTAVSELPPKYRLVIHLYYYEGFSVAEIAEVLKSAEGTVKSQLYRGRSMLRQALKGDYDEL